MPVHDPIKSDDPFVLDGAQEFYVGKKIGRRTIVGGPEKRRGRLGWVLRCECLSETFVPSALLRSPRCPQACHPCAMNGWREPIEIGQRFGLREVIGGPEKQGIYWAWYLRCQCGRESWVKECYLQGGRGVLACAHCAASAKWERINRAILAIGQKVGHRVIVDGPRIVTRGQKGRRDRRFAWLLRCECGREAWVAARDITSKSRQIPQYCSACAKKKHLSTTRSLAHGQAIGKRVIIAGPTTTGHTRWLLKCECGDEKWVSETEIVHGKVALACGHCCRLQTICGNPFAGLRGRERRYWNQIVHNAARRKIAVTVTPEEAFEVLTRQGWRCALTGQAITLQHGASTDRAGTTASLDRIDSAKPYESGNVQWVHKDVNSIKRDYGQAEFLRICELVVKHQRSAARSRRDIGSQGTLPFDLGEPE